MLSEGQCDGGIFTFEKVTGHFLRSARQELIERLEAGSARTITGSGSTAGITVDCGKICLDTGVDCPAYSVDYTQVWFKEHAFY